MVQRAHPHHHRLHLLDSKTLCGYSVVFFNWAVYYFAYFGLQFSATSFGKSILLNYIFFAFIEISGIYIATALSKRYSAHVRTMRWLLLVGGIGCLVIRDQTSVLSVFSVLGALSSREALHHAVLPDTHGLHARNLPDQDPLAGTGVLLAVRKVG